MSLRILFFLQGVSCNGRTVYERPLGGTESAMIFMAAALARRGHRVTVCTEVDTPGVYDGVHYMSWREFEAEATRHPPDVFLCIRSLLPVMVRRWAPVQIYFSPDAYNQPFVNHALLLQFRDEHREYDVGLYSLRFVQQYVDAIFCVGAWQARTFADRFQVPRAKLVVAGNGVHLPDFAAPPSLARRKRQLVYCSTPFRGLEHLLRYFPEIRAQVPDATCLVLSGMQLYGKSAEEDRSLYQPIYDLANQPGVELCGPLPKPQMAARLLESRVLAYPNTFAETFCIAALEAQAAGLPVVSTQLAAMAERVTHEADGFLVPGRPDNAAYRAQFIAHVVRLLTDDALWERQSRAARHKAEPFAYDLLAPKWEEVFVRLRQTPVEPWDFLPQAQRADILVNGYPKQIALSAEVMRRHYATALQYMGLSHCAHRVLQVAENESRA